VAQALAGSESAFEQIVRRYQRPIVNLIARITNDPAQAEDLAQETFVKAFRNLAAFDSTRRFSSWIFRIAHNTAIDALRRHAAGAAVSLDADTPDAEAARRRLASPPAPDPVERAALGRALERALARVRPEYRSAMVLRYDEGLSFEEIAHVMGTPATTARTYVHRARKELSRLLADEGWR
jgi:RNA polymerase sigma-70 factor (ECF subfamily)